jgi:MFS family permease
MAVMSIVTAPLTGRLTDRVHPRTLTVGGFAVLGVSLLLLSVVLAPETPLWQLLAVFALVGLGSSFLWGPLATTANRNLPPQRAGAGSGVYNATRQVGAVLGSAAIAVLIDARLAANGLSFTPSEGGASGGSLPAQVAGPFTDAMAQSLLLLPAVLALGLVSVLFFERPRHFAAAPAREDVEEAADAR